MDNGVLREITSHHDKNRVLFSPLFRWHRPEKISKAHNGDRFKLLQLKKMLIARDEQIRINGHRTFKNAIVWNIFQHGKLACWPDNRGC
jgi:hypothetical protein